MDSQQRRRLWWVCSWDESEVTRWCAVEPIETEEGEKKSSCVLEVNLNWISVKRKREWVTKLRVICHLWKEGSSRSTFRSSLKKRSTLRSFFFILIFLKVLFYFLLLILVERWVLPCQSVRSFSYANVSVYFIMFICLIFYYNF